MSAAFEAAGLVLRRLPPFVASRVRSQTLRLAGVKMGASSVFWDVPTIVGTPQGFERLRIGERCGFNTGCFMDLDAELHIEDDVSVGHDVMLLTRGFSVGPAQRRAQPGFSAPVRIGRGAWLGARCTVLPGVTIGEGAVIGASVVVDKDVPPQTLLMGTQKLNLAKWRAGA